MASAVVIGAGPIGLATSMLLAREGYRVTVLDSDPQAPPDDPAQAWDGWERRGVAQFRMPHIAMPRCRQILDAEFPEVRQRIETAGGLRFNLTTLLPRSLPDRSPRPGDERFEVLTARRPVLEAAFAAAAQGTPGVEIRRGVAVTGPLAGTAVIDGVPHVTGVQTKTGERIEAELIVDAMGRRSPLAKWVTELGGSAPKEEAIDAGFAYYARHFRSQDGRLPEFRAPLGVDLATVRILTMPGDSNAWTMAIVAVAGDAPLKELRHTDTWMRAAACFPHAEQWLAGEPISDILPMAGVLDRIVRFVIDGRPIVTGLVPVGDSWACTNPTSGRGISLGLAHAVALRDTLRRNTGDPGALVTDFGRVTEASLTPWFREQVDRDRQRAAELRAIIDGQPIPPTGPAQAKRAAVMAAAAADPEVARGFLDTLACLALPEEVMVRPGMQERIATFQGLTPQAMPGPARADLLAAVAAV